MEKFNLVIYKDAKIELTPKEQEVFTRLLDGYTTMLNKPHLEDRELVRILQNRYKISRSLAYYDLANIKSLLGNIKNATREWHRYAVIEMLKKAYARADKDNDYFAMVAAADKIGKYTKLDQNDPEPVPYDQIVPPSWEPSDDIRVLDSRLFSPNIRERREALRKKYDPELAQDTSYEEVK